MSLSHLLFADEMVIFLNGHKTDIEKTMDLLHAYEDASGQLIHPEKSSFEVGRKTPNALKVLLHEWTDFQDKSLHTLYLGLIFSS